MTELSAKLQALIVVDASGLDADLITLRCEDGEVRQTLFTKTLYLGIVAGTVTLPDGTPFTPDDLQLAFQNALIAKTGMCVLEHEYHRAGYPELANLSRIARSED